jgi:predicted phage gp36 major capsid-like protein
VRVYEVPMNEDEAMAFYTEALPKAGYQLVVQTDTAQIGRMFAQGPVGFLVTAKQTDAGKSAVSITESRMDNARVLVEQ